MLNVHEISASDRLVRLCCIRMRMSRIMFETFFLCLNFACGSFAFTLQDLVNFHQKVPIVWEDIQVIPLELISQHLKEVSAQKDATSASPCAANPPSCAGFPSTTMQCFILDELMMITSEIKILVCEAKCYSVKQSKIVY